MLTTMGHFLPHLSPASPNMAAPTERSSRVRVMASVILVLETS